MQIKHLTLSCGPTGNFPIGHVRTVDDETGRQLVAGGYAVEIIVEAAPEAAAKRAPETAKAPAAKPRAKGHAVPPEPTSDAVPPVPTSDAVPPAPTSDAD